MAVVTLPVISFEVMPSACSFIVDGSLPYVYLSLFYTTCFGLHGHLQVCMMFYFYIPEGTENMNENVHSVTTFKKVQQKQRSSGGGRSVGIVRLRTEATEFHYAFRSTNKICLKMR
jgi:hypothetical protein